jgi:LacI family repressor for deo operon, udp, cdd, tsx, nupC, and nupG
MVGIEYAARRRGYRLLLGTLDYEEAIPPHRSGAAGVVFVSDLVHRVDLSRLKAKVGVPLVCVYSYQEDPSHASIVPDDCDGAAKATAYLADRGYRDILHLQGIAEWYASRERLRGYECAMAGCGMADRRIVVTTGSWRAEDAWHAVRQALEDGRRPDAVFAASDHLAVGALKALTERGLRVPDDVALVGFDDKELDQFLQPALTSVAMPLRELGEKAFEILLRDVEGPGDSDTVRGLIKLPCTLVERESVLEKT